MNKKLVLSLVALVVLALVLAVLFMPQSANTPGTQEDSTTSESTKSTEATPEADGSTEETKTAAKTVNIDGFAFGPEFVTVKVGDTVTWTNKDSVAHTVTADTASSDAPASGSIGKDETYSFTFTKAGTYPYHCEPHPEMKATVVVEE